MAQLIIDIPDNVLLRLEAAFGLTGQETQKIVKQFSIQQIKKFVEKYERNKIIDEFNPSDIDIT